eukprot:scaffold99709_cov39-Prasinocladus_malaysianus.AAC.1
MSDDENISSHLSSCALAVLPAICSRWKETCVCLRLKSESIRAADASHIPSTTHHKAEELSTDNSFVSR